MLIFHVLTTKSLISKKGDFHSELPFCVLGVARVYCIRCFASPKLNTTRRLQKDKSEPVNFLVEQVQVFKCIKFTNFVQFNLHWSALDKSQNSQRSSIVPAIVLRNKKAYAGWLQTCSAILSWRKFLN